jgi:hypothetical protein
MKPRHFLIVTSLRFVLLVGDQFIFALGITMGKNLEYAQGKEGCDASPEIEITPRVGARDRFPSRYPAHDDTQPLAQ